MNLNENIFSDLHVLVIGDVMLDQYMNGNVFRKSPEADIPVLENVSLSKKLGGAANVAKNIVNLKAKASLLSVCGEDSNGKQLEQILSSTGINTYLIPDSTRQTTIKTRVFADRNQLIRVDQEDKHILNEIINQKFIQTFKEIIGDEKIDIIILQDYNKGVLNINNISKLIEFAKKENIFIAVDPKLENFTLYQEVDLFKPNQKELSAQFPNKNINKNFDLDLIKKQSQLILDQIVSKTILVTLSEHGAMILTKTASYYQKADKIEVVDVCGAGDAVIAISSMALFKGIEKEELLAICNQTGRIVCEKTGVASIHINELNF